MREPPGPQYPTGAPHHTGAAGDDVQRQMAERILPLMKDLQRDAIRYLMTQPSRRGITSMELAFAMNGHIGKLYTWAPRLTELKLAKTIFKSPDRRLWHGRGPLIVWKLHPLPEYDPPPEPDEKMNPVDRENEACARIADAWSPMAAQQIRDRRTKR